MLSFLKKVLFIVLFFPIILPFVLFGMIWTAALNGFEAGEELIESFIDWAVSAE